MRCQQVALHAQQVAPARGEMKRRLHPHLVLDHIAHRPGRHAHARHRAVSHIDHIRAGILKEGGSRD